MTDEEFIDTQPLWPLYPVLPLVNRDYDKGAKGTGVIVAGSPYVVWHVNLFDIPNLDPASPPAATTYESAAEIVADGWRVD